MSQIKIKKSVKIILQYNILHKMTWCIYVYCGDFGFWV